MFTRSARWYDRIYAFKNYMREAQIVHETIRANLRSPGRCLLDVACGTGEHLRYLRGRYDVEGLDLDPAMLEVARRKLPDVRFHEAGMLDFDLGRAFDVVICLFGAVGYLRTVEKLNRGIAGMARHLVPGGLLLVEPWLSPREFRAGQLGSAFVDDPDLKVARFNRSEVVDGVSILDFHYLVATPAGIESLTERHELALFTHEQYVSAFESAGMKPTFDPEGPSGRGLYLSGKPTLA